MNRRVGMPGRVEALESRTYLFAGQQDLSFGELGTASATIEAPIDVNAGGVAVDRNGNAVVAGFVSSYGSSKIYLTRYLPSGALDPKFGKLGVAQFEPPSGDAYVLGVFIQPSGRIVAVCENTIYGQLLAVGFGGDGSRDTGFGTEGIVTATGRVNCATMLSDGSIMVGGYSYSESVQRTASYLHVLADGTLDPAYGGAFRTLRLKGGDAGHTTSFDHMRALSDGSVIAAGEFGGDVMLYKILPSGFGTRRYGTGGLTAIDFGTDDDSASGLVSLADGSVVVLAENVLARVSGDGSVLTTFGESGKASPNFAPSTAEATVTLSDLALAPDGRLLIVGWISSGDPRMSQGFVAAIDHRGQISRGYGNHGVASFGVGSDMKPFIGYLAAIAGDGSLIVAGAAESSPGIRFGVARVRADGSIDTPYGLAGRFASAFSAPAFVSDTRLALQSDGRIVAMTNYQGLEHGVAFARFNADGSIDPTFGNGGSIKIPVDGAYLLTTDLSIDAEGRILGLYLGFETSIPAFRVMRLTASGQLDSSFGTGGFLDPGFADAPGAAALGLQGGKVIVALRGTKLFLRRFDERGDLDTTFGDGGQADVDVQGENYNSMRLAIAQGGVIFVAGQTSGYTLEGDLFGSLIVNTVVKLSAGGTVDSTFGVQGKASARLGINLGLIGTASTVAIALMPDGRIATAGHAGGGAIAMFRSDGTLDTEFGDRGVFHTDLGLDLRDPGAILPVPGGGLLFAGSSNNFFGTSHPEVLRLTRRGQLDLHYGGMASGVASTSGDGYGSVGNAVLQSDGSVLVAGSGALQFVRFLAADSPAITARIDGRVLKIQGTEKADKIILRCHPDGVEVLSIPGRFALNAFSRIEISGLGGDDVIDASSSPVPVFADGGDGDDSILGGAGADSLLGGKGRDTLFGGRDDDSVSGGDGNDYLNGGPGKDQVFGEGGNDQIFAFDAQSDTVDGGDGFDRIKADLDDLLLSGEGGLV